MPKYVPIKHARALAKAAGLSQVVIIGWDGELTHVVTYGQTLADCEAAAQAGNHYKRALGFPESKCNTKPRRARA